MNVRSNDQVSDMTSLGVLQDWFDLAEDDAIKVDTDAVNAEAMANMWVFSPHEEKTQLVTADMLQKGNATTAA